MTSLSILIEKGSSVLKMKWHLSAFVFKKLLENHSRSIFPTSSNFSRVTSTFPEHTYRVLVQLIISASSANKNKPLRNRLNQKLPPEVFYEKICSLAQEFSCEFCETFNNTFLQNTSGRLLPLNNSGSIIDSYRTS